MDKDRRSSEPGRRNQDCDPMKCGMQQKLETIMNRFSTIAEKLSENQIELRVGFQKLADTVDFISKLDNKVDRVEAKTDANSSLVWKLVGVASTLAVLAPLIWGLILL